MLDFTWKIFSNTGNIDTYLLFKQLEQDRDDDADLQMDERAVDEFPLS
ncbi:YqzL family protein [Metabacillus sp. GX 13764]|nr:YqzL family protein [Metabacillus kandeliae]MCD7033061.1 YqzL family protein [Metabacillus kandeliae]